MILQIIILLSTCFYAQASEVLKTAETIMEEIQNREEQLEIYNFRNNSYVKNILEQYEEDIKLINGHLRAKLERHCARNFIFDGLANPDHLKENVMIEKYANRNMELCYIEAINRQKYRGGDEQILNKLNEQLLKYYHLNNQQ